MTIGTKTAPQDGSSWTVYDLPAEGQKQRSKSARAFKGHAQPPQPSRQATLAAHSDNLDALIVKSSIVTPNPIVLPEVYHPSSARIQDLKKVFLPNLTIEVRHRGSFLLVKAITPPYITTATIITIIEDENGAVGRLSLYCHDRTSSKSILSRDAIMMIKEPYLQFYSEQDLRVRVDHPSDISFLHPTNPLIPPSLHVNTDVDICSSYEWKQAGDKAYLQKDYLTAISHYTHALSICEPNNKELENDILRKRANLNFLFRNYDQSKLDALASCKGGNLDFRYHALAGRAAYEQGVYEESLSYFKNALKGNPNDKNVQRDYNRALSRIQEQMTGEYDLKSMSESVNKNMHLDHGNFYMNTAIKLTKTRGRGLFSSRALKAGDIVLCEKALCLPDPKSHDFGLEFIIYDRETDNHIPSSGALLVLELAQKLYRTPSLNAQFWGLDSGVYRKSGSEGSIVDGVPVIDIFLIEAIRARNSFSCPLRSSDFANSDRSKENDATSVGIWVRAAYMNHSCVPNCVRSFIGDMMIIRATCDIPVDTELTHQYVSPDPNFAVRRAKMLDSWGFECDCLACTNDKQSPDKMHKARADLFNQIKIEAMKRGPTSAATIRQIERLTKSLEELYEPGIYSNSPRLFLVHPSIWLMEAYRARKNHQKVLKYSLQILRNFGFIDPVRNRQLRVYCEPAMTGIEPIRALLYASEAYFATGDPDMALQCEETAQLGYVMITGSAEGVDRFLKSTLGK